MSFWTLEVVVRSTQQMDIHTYR
jgi:hypothetical protein